MRVKICGITQPDQGCAIATLGATELGFICVNRSPRYVTPVQIQGVIEQLPTPPPNRIGVFADVSLDHILHVLDLANLNGIQLHGNESPDFCHQLKKAVPDREVIKAIRLRSPEQLSDLNHYAESVDTFLLDAFHPQQLGGTGQTLDWTLLAHFHPDRPWFLAGGLTPDNVALALHHLQPNGIDLSSGVEVAPGNKDLHKVRQLLNVLAQIELASIPPSPAL